MTVSVVLHPEEVEALRDLQAASGGSASAVVREALRLSARDLLGDLDPADSH